MTCSTDSLTSFSIQATECLLAFSHMTSSYLVTQSTASLIIPDWTNNFEVKPSNFVFVSFSIYLNYLSVGSSDAISLNLTNSFLFNLECSNSYILSKSFSVCNLDYSSVAIYGVIPKSFSESLVWFSYVIFRLSSTCFIRFKIRYLKFSTPIDST